MYPRYVPLNLLIYGYSKWYWMLWMLCDKTTFGTRYDDLDCVPHALHILGIGAAVLTIINIAL